MMKRFVRIGVIVSLLLPVYGHGQSNYYDYDHTNFRNVEIFNSTIDIENIDFEMLNALMFYLTNEIRVKNNLTALRYNPLLEKAAMVHSEEMTEKDFFDHINKRNRKLKTPNDRAIYVGISNPHLAENIAESFMLMYQAGNPVYPGGKGIFRYDPDDDPIGPHTYLSLAESTINDWMNSPNHKKNIMSKEAIELGCGCSFFIKKDFNDMPTIYATQNFQLFELIRQTDERENE